jgi:ABC-type nickel/cobalt efflux system permease component RcnA
MAPILGRIAASLLLPLAALAPALAADPFTGGAGPRDSFGGGVLLPGLVGWVAHQQAGLNGAISAAIREVAQGGSWSALATVLGLAFLFGVLHAVGPGHGKFVVSSYLLSRRATIARGVAMGGLVSLVQGIVAILLVAILGIFLRLARFDVLDHAATVETVSYGLILLIGLKLLYHALRGDAHDHAHGALPAAGALDHHHGHADHAHHDHAHDRHAHHDHAPGRRERSPVQLILAAGLVPCSSAIIVMLFALANGAFFIGAEAAIAMSVGMGMTVAGIGVLSIVARRIMLRFASLATDRAGLLERGLGIAGSGALVLFSALLLSGALLRL